MARGFVRFSGSAAKKAAFAPKSAAATKVARFAALAAAKRHAPGLLRASGALTPPRSRKRIDPLGQSGQWVGRGRTLIVMCR